MILMDEEYHRASKIKTRKAVVRLVRIFSNAYGVDRATEIVQKVAPGEFTTKFCQRLTKDN